MKKILSAIAVITAVMIPGTGNTGKSYKFAVGFKGGTYEKCAQSLNNITPFKFKVVNSQGSTEIIKMVNQGEVDFGIAQLDILLDLDQREREKTQNVKFVLQLYSEEVHLLVDNKINSYNELKGKTLSIGAKNSGSAGTAMIVLDKLNLWDVLKSFRNMDVRDGLSGLQKGRIDAMIVVSGVPVKMLTQLPLGLSQKVRLLPFSDEQYEKVTENQYHYRKSVVKANSYPWLKEDVNTISVVSAIIVNKDVPDDDVSALVKYIFSKKSLLAKRHPKWKELDKDTITWYLEGRSYLFHPAAIKALASVGIKSSAILAPE